MNTIISLKNIKKEYRLGATVVNALRGVTLDIEEKKHYSIMGPSGSGKSTLLHIIGAMDNPSEGTVVFNGLKIHELNESELTHIRARDIGFIFQAFHLNPILTAGENVAISLRFLGVNKKESMDRSIGYLEKVGLKNRANHYPSELSGGERQRVAIARAIVKKPKLILADEPTGNLDSEIGNEIIELLRQINKEEQTTIIVITHDSEIANKGDIVINMKDGKNTSQRNLLARD